jgi:hypothetical protein
MWKFYLHRLSVRDTGVPSRKTVRHPIMIELDELIVWAGRISYQNSQEVLLVDTSLHLDQPRSN